MFEDYLEDANYLYKKGKNENDIRVAKCYYRASIFYAASALEAFINHITDILTLSGTLKPFEVALLNDKKFLFNGKCFEIQDKFELHSIEDKLRFIICNKEPDFDFNTFAAWSQCIEFRNFRNNIVHPKNTEDEITIEEYKRKFQMGFNAVIELIDYLCVIVIYKPLRSKIKDLKV